MRAAILESPGTPLVIADDVDHDDPRPGEVLVRVTHCGVCHSDLSVVDGVFPAMTPVVCGHEPAGVVEAVGSAVTALAPGDKVVLTCRPQCGRCAFCVRGDVHFCAHATELVMNAREDGTTPLSRNGEPVWMGLGLAAFAEYVVTKETGAIKIPDDTPLEVAAVLGCSVQTGTGAALNTAGVGAGATVMVLGLGGVGISAVQGARIGGASMIIGVDAVAERREQAKRFGVTHTVDPAAGDVASAVLELTDGVGVDFAFEAVGRAALLDTCISSTTNGGTITAMGVGPLDEVLSVPLTFFVMTGKRVQGCLLGSSNGRRDIPRYLDLWRTGRLDLEGMITQVRPLDEINDAFDDMRAGRGLRTMLEIAKP
jgi:Zn-dependent alcohol dehydrogenase